MDLAALLCGKYASADHRQGSCGKVPADLNLSLAADRSGKFFQLLDQGVDLGVADARWLSFATLAEPQPIVQVIVGRGFLAIDIQQVVLGGGGIACIEGGERPVLMLQNQAGNVGIVAG